MFRQHKACSVVEKTWVQELTLSEFISNALPNLKASDALHMGDNVRITKEIKKKSATLRIIAVHNNHH